MPRWKPPVLVEMSGKGPDRCWGGFPIVPCLQNSHKRSGRCSLVCTCKTELWGWGNKARGAERQQEAEGGLGSTATTGTCWGLANQHPPPPVWGCCLSC